MINQQIILAKRPFGTPDDTTWNLVESQLPQLENGQFRIRNEFISVDPAMRGWISKGKSYIEPVDVGDVMRAGCVGKVTESKHPEYREGDVLVGWSGVQQMVTTDGKGYVKVDPMGLPLEKFLSVLGMTGFTAYFGLLDIGKPKPGETVVISAAAGAVGSIVGQIASIHSCRAVGIAGGPEKCRYVVEELGFDDCIDYKNESMRKALRDKCPDGIDIYFDNVGGEILDEVLLRINKFARIPLCGAISQYNNTEPIQGPSNYLSLLVNRARLEGFIVFDYNKEYRKASLQIGAWMKEGKLKSHEQIETGIENFPAVFRQLFTGDKLGKLVLKV